MLGKRNYHKENDQRAIENYKQHKVIEKGRMELAVERVQFRWQSIVPFKEFQPSHDPLAGKEVRFSCQTSL